MCLHTTWGQKRTPGLSGSAGPTSRAIQASKRHHTRKGIHCSPIATGMFLLATPFARSKLQFFLLFPLFSSYFLSFLFDVAVRKTHIVLSFFTSCVPFASFATAFSTRCCAIANAASVGEQNCFSPGSSWSAMVFSLNSAGKVEHWHRWFPVSLVETALPKELRPHMTAAEIKVFLDAPLESLDSKQALCLPGRMVSAIRSKRRRFLISDPTCDCGT
ncbi:unnamed protein product [Acanthosepion pharaonis]|uniref:Uncharacterized protein n=1 Tax=Acanthosepion pharaonis TaxID=158019 RepID=A0A812CU28_ACAPH|nr:unnamed protein product [Sepia pharaonis]